MSSVMPRGEEPERGRTGYLIEANAGEKRKGVFIDKNCWESQLK
jgi:hypothetical protein